MGATGDDTRLMALGMLGRVLDEGRHCCCH